MLFSRTYFDAVGSQWDVTRDGDRFLMLKPVAASDAAGQEQAPLQVISVHSMTLRHSQGRHAVQDLAANSGFHSLTLQRSGPDHRTDDGLVPTHRGFGQTSLAVAGPGVPWACAEDRSRSDVAIALSGTRRLRPELRVLRRWDEHSWRAALTVSLDRRVDFLGVIG